MLTNLMGHVRIHRENVLEIIRTTGMTSIKALQLLITRNLGM